MTITEFRTQFEQMETTDLEGCIAGMRNRYETGAFMGHGFAAGADEAQTWAERITLAEEVLAERMDAAQTLVNSVFEPNAAQRAEAQRERELEAEKQRIEAEMMSHAEESEREYHEREQARFDADEAKIKEMESMISNEQTFEQQVEEVLSSRTEAEIHYDGNGNYKGGGFDFQVLPEEEWFNYCREFAQDNNDEEPTIGGAERSWNQIPEIDRFVIDGIEYAAIAQ